MADVVRQDVIQVSFDIDNNPLQDIIKDLNNLKATLTSSFDTEPFDELTEGAEDVKDSVKGITDEADKLKEGLDDIPQPLKESTTNAKKLDNSMEDVADTNLKTLQTHLTNISNKLTEVAKKAAGAAYAGLKKLAGISFKALIGGIAGVTAIVASSVASYADYEQLIGGVETLFKDSAGTIQKYANNAYKTAGLSANEYMETVTSFSASLLQSLGGDTAKAATYADMAISDMSDNANKMGSDMGLIQNAYQGFAKSNYTMLDNLKLGELHHCRAQ